MPKNPIAHGMQKRAISVEIRTATEALPGNTLNCAAKAMLLAAIGISEKSKSGLW